MGNSSSSAKKNIKNNRVYVLKLENDKYYVGRTTKPVTERFNEHLSGQGSAWTALHKPIRIIENIEYADDFDEDKYTKKYMSLYGINNVRGASYVSVELSEFQIKSLEQELCSSQNKCFKCHEPGHYANQCGKSTQNEQQIKNFIETTSGIIAEIVDNYMDNDSVNNEKLDTNVEVTDTCDKKSDTNIENPDTNIEPIDTDCKKLDASVDSIDTSDKKLDARVCFRCGRLSHWRKDCFAKRHINGRWLG